MREYIKKFESPESAHNYSIVNIPFITSVATTPIQNLVCNKTGKHLENDNGTVIICPPDANIEFVDLGLSVKWAKYLYGVNPNQLTNASDWYGKYLMWGELEEKSGWDGQGNKVPYDWANYTRHTNGTYSAFNKKVFIKYIPTSKTEYWNGDGSPDGLTTLESVDDVASVNYGGNWRMPRRTELNELKALQSQWVNNYNPDKNIHNTEDDEGIQGLNGRVFTGTNGNTLFIPAAGCRDGSDIYDVGSDCYLWSLSLAVGLPYYAYNLYINSGGINMNNNNRYYGYSVCPVLETP